jgi:hypothetical protein
MGVAFQRTTRRRCFELLNLRPIGPVKLVLQPQQKVTQKQKRARRLAWETLIMIYEGRVSSETLSALDGFCADS